MGIGKIEEKIDWKGKYLGIGPDIDTQFYLFDGL
jgi:hypothetical protein